MAAWTLSQSYQYWNAKCTLEDARAELPGRREKPGHCQCTAPHHFQQCFELLPSKWGPECPISSSLSPSLPALGMGGPHARA